MRHILGALRRTLTPPSKKHSSVAQREKILWSLVTQKSFSLYAPSLKSHIDPSPKQPSSCPSSAAQLLLHPLEIKAMLSSTEQGGDIITFAVSGPRAHSFALFLLLFLLLFPPPW